MKRISSSATKIVLLMFSLTTCIGFLRGQIETSVFMGVMGIIIAFYFGSQKGQKDDINTNSNGDTV